MISRKHYLQEPEKWKGTPEEAELILFCQDYLLNKRNFHFNFSPTMVDVKKNEEQTNNKAKEIDQYFNILTLMVLEVHDELHKSNTNKRDAGLKGKA